MEFHANLDTALDREGRHVPGVIKAVISITVIDVLVTLLSLSIH